jgi:hypothetical protein
VPKEYQKLWMAELERVAHINMTRMSVAPKIDPENPNSNFDLVVSLIYAGAEARPLDAWGAEDQVFLETFRRAKLNVEDPFQWWQMLHSLIMLHTDRTSGRSTRWTNVQIRKLEKDCVRVGRAFGTNSIKEICKRLKDDLHYEQTSENLQTLVTRFRLTSRIKRKLATKQKVARKRQ